MISDPFSKDAALWRMIYGEAADRMSLGTMPVPMPETPQGEAGTAPTDFWHDLMNVPREVAYDPSRDDTAGFYQAIAAKLQGGQAASSSLGGLPSPLASLMGYSPEVTRSLRSMAKGGSVAPKPMGALAQTILHNILTALATNPKAAEQAIEYISSRRRSHGAR